MTSKPGRKPIIPTEPATGEQLETAYNIIMDHAEQQRRRHANLADLANRTAEIKKATTIEEKNRINAESSE
jgi:hypothetical protein